MPVGLLGLHLPELDPLPHHAPRRAGPHHQFGEARQRGHGGGRLESVNRSLKWQQIDTFFLELLFFTIAELGWRSGLGAREQDFKLGSTLSTCKVLLFSLL